MTPRKTPHTEIDESGFDVTCVIGRVFFDAMGADDSPYVAAFKLIGQHGAEGEFTFPHESGDTVRVSVDFSA